MMRLTGTPALQGGEDVSLDVSMVLYHPEAAVLQDAVRSVAEAADALRAARPGSDVRLRLVDNAAVPDRAALERLLAAVGPGLPLEILAGHGNVGYGAGHNRAIRSGRGDFHLVLNHDVRLDRTALVAAFDFLDAHPAVVLLSPRVRNPAGGREYICKRTPTLLDLALRGFAPAAVRARFARRLARYEMRDATGDRPAFGLEHAGGAFMLFRRPVLEALGGFDERFFLYFEDFDLSRRAARLGTVAYAPSVGMVHLGGGAARKGWLHRRLFVASAARFFAKHGWRVA